MLLYYFYEDFELNAQYHCDKHVVKMITEQTQLLASAYYFTDYVQKDIYRLTHANHPCAKWVRESLSNWLWLQEATYALCAEYTHRYGREHACLSKVRQYEIPHLCDIGLTPFAEAMPDQYKNTNVIIAYRDYYNGEKQHLFAWKNRSEPYWIERK